jgi:hypothetical protein
VHKRNYKGRAAKWHRRTRKIALIIELKTVKKMAKNRAAAKAQMYKQAKSGDHCRKRAKIGAAGENCLRDVLCQSLLQFVGIRASLAIIYIIHLFIYSFLHPRSISPHRPQRRLDVHSQTLLPRLGREAAMRVGFLGGEIRRGRTRAVISVGGAHARARVILSLELYQMC